MDHLLHHLTVMLHITIITILPIILIMNPLHRHLNPPLGFPSLMVLEAVGFRAKQVSSLPKF